MYVLFKGCRQLSIGLSAVSLIEPTVFLSARPLPRLVLGGLLHDCLPVAASISGGAGKTGSHQPER